MTSSLNIYLNVGNITRTSNLIVVNKFFIFGKKKIW